MSRPILLAVLVLAGTLPVRAETPAAGGRLACAAPFGPDASHASIAAAFGRDAVVYRKIDGPEGEKIGATIVYPKDPARRLELIWDDEKKRSGLANVRFSETTAWIAPNGVRRGMSLSDVEALNGGPFVLSGFDWDYGGYVTDWKGGVLGRPLPGGCIVQVRFGYTPDAPEPAALAVSGDKEFPSNDRNMRLVKPRVGALGFAYRRP